ncbi:hypothetical protein FB45DRAFT_1082335 [Roridomyces roridus]|uniref:Uncharacterized protein n=1 Tax=Roridomyces roridus TaxID=1738132 RepID=A0AAD7BQ41_9AGAR|nr:hypothetical protein FB45DRAFT_1082335 [Roridomyces roridus]
MMGIAMVAPELVAGFAVRQFRDARELSKEYGFSISHGYLFAMGGLVDPSGYVVAAKQQLNDPAILQALCKVDALEIEDKSKPAGQIICLTLWAIVWLCNQLAARRSRNLPATGLEYATLAFAVMNLVTWRYWRYKPLRVNIPICTVLYLQPGKPARSAELPSRIHILTALVGNRVGDHRFSPFRLASVPEFWSTGIFPLSDFGAFDFFLVALPSIVFGTIHCAAWNAVDLPTAAEMWLWKVSSLSLVSVPLIAWSMILFVRRAGAVPAFILWPLIATYILARLVLIGLCFAQPSASIFVDVDVFIPHPLSLIR